MLLLDENILFIYRFTVKTIYLPLLLLMLLSLNLPAIVHYRNHSVKTTLFGLIWVESDSEEVGLTEEERKPKGFSLAVSIRTLCTRYLFY